VAGLVRKSGGPSLSALFSAAQLSLLSRMRNAVLATTGPHGSPHVAPVWYFWDGQTVRISTNRTTQKVADIEHDPRVALCVDDQVSGEYLTIYGTAIVVEGEEVTALTWPLLERYFHPDESSARWARIDAGHTRVVILITPVTVAGRSQVK
jgi:PPOX class probable F420-dependent enzyme